ncbi:protein of unknown function [Kyrpidia spormannii]|uniref:Uncharacterized protein n=2 Tax=Kyrpidia spormannii TaxID=2055160 RepID=A0ACA8Z8X0_9BACL|nr:protein of unknown function [Kyrpidia spormannii]CAB3393338.1 protein of unknown function [Kyrpidia spormannii]
MKREAGDPWIWRPPGAGTHRDQDFERDKKVGVQPRLFFMSDSLRIKFEWSVAPIGSWRGVRVSFME